MLTGFSQFSPLDAVPASDSTEVFTWYSAKCDLASGSGRHEAHGQVHATLADRDKITSDDYVQLFLSTFNDGRQATVLAVNPLGVQADGALVETGSISGQAFNGAIVRREATDLSPTSCSSPRAGSPDTAMKWRVRVPFKSLRYQPAGHSAGAST